MNRVVTVTDPKNIVSKTYSDAAGRTIMTIENYTDGTPTDTTNKTVEYKYNAAGQMETLKVVLPDGIQETKYVYGVYEIDGNAINDPNQLREVIQPNKQSGGATFEITDADEDSDIATITTSVPHLLQVGDRITIAGVNDAGYNGTFTVASIINATTFTYAVTGTLMDDRSGGTVRADGERDVYLYNALGQVKSFTDRNGTVHEYEYDPLGRQTVDRITTPGAGVDESVLRRETKYDTQGNPYLFTSYDAATGGSIVNQVKREFNGFGQITKEYQAIDGAVTIYTPFVEYQYAATSSGSRLTGIVYPSGYAVQYNYALDLDDNISRLSSITDASGTLEYYDYLGNGTVVRRTFDQTGVAMSYIKLFGETTGDAGDQYNGLDRFGRVVDQRWSKATTPPGSTTTTYTAIDRLQYGYDQQSNRTYKQNLVDATQSELYANDATGQLTSFKRGTLNSSKDAIATPTREQSWGHDATGNWDTVTTDGIEEEREHNAQNEIVSFEDGPVFGHDDNGNMTADQNGHELTLDAWNRLVSQRTGEDVFVISYTYDSLNRRISEEHTNGSVRDFYYSTAEQVLEERVRDHEDTADAAVKQVRYVWSPIGSDLLILRDRDTDANGTLDERLYVQQDANGNVTSLTDASGNIVERFAYDPFGRSTVLTDDFTTTTDSYEWHYRHQGLYVDPTTSRVYNRARWLDVDLGRFISVDPLGFAAGDVNLRRYVGNGPVSAVDPSGMDVEVRYFEGANAEGEAGRRLGHLVDKLKKDRRLKGLPITFTGYENNTFAAFTAYNSTSSELKDAFSTPSDKVPKELGRDRYNRSVLIGYSNGGLAITKIVGQTTSKQGQFEAPAIQIDLVITIDPVSAQRSFLRVDTPKVLDVKIGQSGYRGPAVSKWINWHQRSDTKSFLTGILGSSVRVFDSTTPPQLTPILAFDNSGRITGIQEWIGVAPYQSTLFDRSRFQRPEHAHTEIISDAIIYERIVTELLKLAESPYRGSPVLRKGPYLEGGETSGPAHPGPTR